MTFDINSLNHEERFALLYGIMLGDDCLSLVNGKNKFISITGSLDDDLPFFQEVISPLMKYFRGKDTNIKFRKDCRAMEFNFTDINLFDLISSNGFPIGKKGPNLVIPDIFYKNNLLRNIIQGFFATDGSLVLTKNPNKFYPRVEGNGISNVLILQISDYLKKIGMKGNLYNVKRNEIYFKEYIHQEQYRFQFNGMKNLILFNEKIGFVNPKHQIKFDNFLRYNKEYVSSSKKKLILIS